ncbi:Smr/MutS family protein [Parvularcula oceani]|uniref:Smr/MutS family protein n=1 Tax=Parvularcula oceani TaxID=1247963 RepID=UPI0004E0EC6C|nr:Smr/MutS family protein [Parvularcula oceani]
MRRREGRGRRLSASERALWQAVAESVTPLDPAPAPNPGSGPESLPEAPPPPAGPVRRRKTAGPPAPPPQRAAPPPPPAKLDGGDPKLARRVARGRREIDATLDLHGMTQAAAYARLVSFVGFAAANGARTLLVVTGKGSDAPAVPFAEAPRGILRRRFLDWVEEAPLSERIASVRQAHQKHGGRGAFYVFLKRRRG